MRRLVLKQPGAFDCRAGPAHRFPVMALPERVSCVHRLRRLWGSALIDRPKWLRPRKPLRRSPLRRNQKPIKKVSAKRAKDLQRLARIRDEWWAAGNIICGICGLPILYREDLDSDHKTPGKMGGCKDHSRKNLQPAHRSCNIEKGSIRNFTKVRE